MAVGYWLVKGDKTSCGGVIHEGTARKQFRGHPAAMDGFTVSCGKHPGLFNIDGGHPGHEMEGKQFASTLYSRTTCPCKAHLIPSQTWAWHAPWHNPIAKPSTNQSVSLQQLQASSVKRNTSVSDTCRAEDNKLLNGVYIWTEIIDAGHTFVSVHEDNSIYVYTYGRFGLRGFANLTGDGILNFLINDDARVYYREELYKVNARVFRIEDASIAATRLLFENLWNAGSKPTITENMGDRTRRRGRVIGIYDITGNNCTTLTVSVISRTGSNIFKSHYVSTTTQLPIHRNEDFTVPLSLQNHLLKKGRSLESMNVLEVTHEFKKQYPNIDRYGTESESQILKNLAKSASMLSSASGYSGGTVKGFLGSSYDINE